jgi:predicted nucleic acid-binding protein
VTAVPRVLDAYSLIAYFENEKGSEEMIELLKGAGDSGQDLILSVVNWGEVYYITLREAGEEKAKEVEEVIGTLPISIVGIDLELASQAAQFKARNRMSYADCFAAALAKIRQAELVTGDPEFKQIEGEVTIHWLR